MEVGIITNPNSRKNRGHRRRAERLQNIIGEYGDVRETRQPDTIKPVLRDFLRHRRGLWVSDGGDGALHWMLRFGFQVLREEEFAGQDLPVVMPTNGGTIDFVAKNVGIKGDAESILSTLRRRLEAGAPVESVEVKAMLIDGIEVTDSGERPFETIGFAAAVGGIGQRFFTKYYEAEDPNPQEIVRVVARTLASYPVANTPLGRLPGLPNQLRTYASDMFRPTSARLTVDGRELAATKCTGIHIASMSIDLGGVMRFFGQADDPEQLHAIAGAPAPWEIIRNLPRMYLGKRMVASDLFDGPCREMTVEAVGDELLAPVIDGECYRGLRRLTFRLGPRLRIAKVAPVGSTA